MWANESRSECVPTVSRQAISRTRRTVSGSALWYAVWSAFTSRQPPARITSLIGSTFLRVAPCIPTRHGLSHPGGLRLAEKNPLKGIHGMGQHVNEVSSEVLELAHLYERAPIGLCVTDTQHRYVRINQRLSDINGKPVEEHIGRTIHEVIPHISDQMASMFQNVIDSSEPVLAHEVRGHSSAYPAGERIFLGDHYPLLSKVGRVLYVHTMIQDVTITAFRASLAPMGNGNLTLGERLMIARGRCGLTKVAVARRVLDPGEDKKPRSATIGAWEQEKMGLTLPRLRRLAGLYEKVGGISPSWVVLGNGPIMRPDLEETP